MYFVTICCQDKIWRFGSIENKNMLLNDFGEIAVDEWLKLSQRYPNVLLDVFQIMPNHVHGIIVLENVVPSSSSESSSSVVGATLAVAFPAVPPNTVTQNMVATNNTIATNVNGDMDILNDGVGVGIGMRMRAGASPAPTGTGMETETATATGMGMEMEMETATGMGTAMATETETETGTTVGNIVGAYKSLVANRCLEICKTRNEYMGKLWQRNYWEHIIRTERAHQYIANYIINNPQNWEKDKFLYEIIHCI
jgi:REP element-mobilizing transposase RayT